MGGFGDRLRQLLLEGYVDRMEEVLRKISRLCPEPGCHGRNGKYGYKQQREEGLEIGRAKGSADEDCDLQQNYRYSSFVQYGIRTSLARALRSDKRALALPSHLLVLALNLTGPLGMYA